MNRWIGWLWKVIFACFSLALLVIIIVGLYKYLLLLFPETDFWKKISETGQLIGSLATAGTLMFMYFSKRSDEQKDKFKSLTSKLDSNISSLLLDLNSDWFCKKKAAIRLITTKILDQLTELSEFENGKYAREYKDSIKESIWLKLEALKNESFVNPVVKLELSKDEIANLRIQALNLASQFKHSDKSLAASGIFEQLCASIAVNLKVSKYFVSVQSGRVLLTHEAITTALGVLRDFDQSFENFLNEHFINLNIIGAWDIDALTTELIKRKLYILAAYAYVSHKSEFASFIFKE